MGGGRCRERLTDDPALDPSNRPADRSAGLHRFFGRDQIPGTRTLEVVTMLADYADVAITNMLSLNLLPSNQICLNPRRRLAWRPKGLCWNRRRFAKLSRTGGLQPAKTHLRVDLSLASLFDRFPLVDKTRWFRGRWQ